MSEEFKGTIPEIEIRETPCGIFTYYCKKYDKSISYPCFFSNVVFDDCYDCLGFNKKFIRLFQKNARCVSCTTKLNFGYFILIYLLEKAGLLPSNFRMFCCVCRAREQESKKI